MLGLSHIGKIGREVYLAKLLNVKRCLFLYFLCHNVLPKKNNKNALCFSDIYFIDKIEQKFGPPMNGIPFACVIIWGMRDTIRTNKKLRAFDHARVLTCIF